MPRAIDHVARKNDLCTAVIALATEHGFHAVTFRAVAKAIGASTSSVTHYFSSRDALVTAAVSREFARFQCEITAALDGLCGGEAIIAFFELTVVAPRPGIRSLWLSAIESARREPVLREELRRFIVFWDRTLDSYVAQVDSPGYQDSPSRQGALKDLIDVLGSGLVSLSFQDMAWAEDRRRQLVASVVGPRLGLDLPAAAAR